MITPLKMTMALLAAVAAVTGWAVPARAVCSTATRVVHFVEYPEGGAALTPEIERRFADEISSHLREGRVVESYYVLASGDIAEGAAWDAAAPDQRSADRRLGEARAASLRDMLARMVGALRSPRVEVKIRDNRQVFSAAELAADPRLNQRLRAGVAVTIRAPAPVVPEGQPAPVC